MSNARRHFGAYRTPSGIFAFARLSVICSGVGGGLRALGLGSPATPRVCSRSHRRDRYGLAMRPFSSGRVVSSQDGGRNNRQSTAAEAFSLAACTDTAIWQFATLPRVPEYCRATPGEAYPSLTNPVSSTIHTSGSMTSTARAASRRRTAVWSHVEEVRNCCSR